MEEIRKQNQEQLGIGGGAEASVQDLSTVMELSKRDEEARLNRLREEEEELEKVHHHYQEIFKHNFFFYF